MREKLFTRNTAEPDLHQESIAGVPSTISQAGLANFAVSRSSMSRSSGSDISAIAAIGSTTSEDQASVHETISSTSSVSSCSLLSRRSTHAFPVNF